MQTLGLSDSTPRTESALRSLFWPSIETTYDVEYVTSQGFWICILVGAFSLVIALFTGQSLAVLLDALFFFLGACGVRRRSWPAALLIFLVYALPSSVPLLRGFSALGIVRIIFAGLLLSNVRAIWIARRLPAEEPIEDLALLRWTDRLSGAVPRIVWPIGRFVFYPLAALNILALEILGVIFALHFFWTH